jgi:surfeit locus 1 family protein
MLSRPSATLGLALLPPLILFASLGFWQLHRMQEKQELFKRFEQAPELTLSQAAVAGNPFARVKVHGRYLPDWHLLLDNKILQGRVGVHVMTLFQPDEGIAVLVNRGWLPLPPDRSSLPDIPTPGGEISIAGILARPADEGIRLGEPDRLEALSGPRLVTYLEMDALRTVLGGKLMAEIIRLDATDPSGFMGRDWKPAVMLPAQHAAYAAQWFALSLSMPIIWIVVHRRWRRRKNTPADAANRGVV